MVLSSYPTASHTSGCLCHSRKNVNILTISLSAVLVATTMPSAAFAFAPPSVVPIVSHTQQEKQQAWVLYEVIEGMSEKEDPVDEGLGGVRLAQESAIKIVGDIKHKPGNSQSFPMELLRYNTLKQVEESLVQDVLKKTGSFVLCYGQGVELYKDPGETTIKEVYYAPKEAIKDALTNAASAMDSETLVFNFLGGDDLMCGEVLQAANELVLDLDIATKTKISFNSLCHKTIPSGTCAVTVVSLGNQQEDGSASAGVEKAIASGEIYLRDGVWYTVEESDINTAIE